MKHLFVFGLVLGYFFGVGAVAAIGMDGVLRVACRIAPMIVAPGNC